MPYNRKPDVKIHELRDDYLNFELYNTDISMANSLRRIMIAEVPTLCIDHVQFEDNTSVLQDEIVAHRLGLIPLRSDRQGGMSEWNYQYNCTCDGYCDLCSVVFQLDCDFDVMKQLPEYANAISIPVTSKDLISSNKDVYPVHQSNDDEAMKSLTLNNGIVIVRLGPGQRIKFTAYALKGVGKEHAKFSPVATVALKHDPIITIRDEYLEDFDLTEKEELVACCPTQVFELDESTAQVVVKDAGACIFCKECQYKLEDLRRKPEDLLAVQVKHSDNRFLFTVETTGALLAKEVVTMALSMLGEKFTKLQRAIPNLTRTDERMY